MSKPTFVCIHGAWHSPSCFDGIKSMLSTYGYDCVCPSLPSVGGNPPTDDFTEDVTAIKSTVEELVNVKDVIVVMHSYSGIPGGQALEGLDKKSCVEKGLKGGVVRLVYMMAFIVPEGFQHSPKGTRDNMVPSMKTDFKVITTAATFSDTWEATKLASLGRYRDCRPQRHERPALPRSLRRRCREMDHTATPTKYWCVLEHDNLCRVAPHTHNVCCLQKRCAFYGSRCGVATQECAGRWQPQDRYRGYAGCWALSLSKPGSMDRQYA